MSAPLRRSLLPALLALACRESPASSEAIGHLEVRWKGARDGGVSGTASATWCEHRRFLEIRTIRGDTGIALALYPAKALAGGVYPVVDPARAGSFPPAAGVAVRWLTQSLVQGFQGDSGSVNLQRSSTGQLSGDLNARARSVVDTQRVRLSGSFRHLTVVRDSLGCLPLESTDEDADDDAEPADTGIH